MPGRDACSKRRTRAIWICSSMSDPVVDDPPLQVRTGQSGRVEVVQRQVDPAAVEVLTDVADEVRELEGDAQILGRFVRVGRQRLEDGHHLQPDDGGGAVHVLVEVVVGLVLGDGEVHRHRVQERLEVLDRDVPATHRVHDGIADRVRAAPASHVGEEASPHSLRCVCGGDVVASGHIDDLVGVAGEAVQRVHVRSLGRGSSSVAR